MFYSEPESVMDVREIYVGNLWNLYLINVYSRQITPTPCPGLYITTSTTESLITILICVMWKIVVIKEVSVQGIFQQFVLNILSNFMLKSSTVTSRTRKKTIKCDCDQILAKLLDEKFSRWRKKLQVYILCNDNFVNRNSALLFCFVFLVLLLFFQAYSTVEIVYITW